MSPERNLLLFCKSRVIVWPCRTTFIYHSSHLNRKCAQTLTEAPIPFQANLFIQPFPCGRLFHFVYLHSSYHIMWDTHTAQHKDHKSFANRIKYENLFHCLFWQLWSISTNLYMFMFMRQRISTIFHSFGCVLSWRMAYTKQTQ